MQQMLSGAQSSAIGQTWLACAILFHHLVLQKQIDMKFTMCTFLNVAEHVSSMSDT